MTALVKTLNNIGINNFVVVDVGAKGKIESIQGVETYLARVFRLVPLKSFHATQFILSIESLQTRALKLIPHNTIYTNCPYFLPIKK
jgi:hypothetical protein